MPTPLEAALHAVLARIRVRHALAAMTAGAIAAAATLLVTRASGASMNATVGACALAAATGGSARFASLRRGRTLAWAASAIERADPSLRNLVVTAQELMTRPGATPDYMRSRVLAEAGRRVSARETGGSVPFRRDLVAALAGAALLATAATVPVPAVEAGHVTVSPHQPVARPADSFEIDIVPPSYADRPAVHLRNPASLEALAGSQATIRVPPDTAADIRLNGAAIRATRDGVAEAALSTSGYLAIDAGAVHRLLPLSVTPDRAPEVRMTAPAKDLRIATTAVTIPIAAEAADDLALRSFELRYTVVSGTGEQFSFTEGTLPATLARGSDRSWRLDTSLSPARLKLEPGDALIYRAVASDRRPGDAGAASSDTFFVEIAGPGDVALAGVELPPDKERYALSQAMIVLKIERLQAREQGKGMGRSALVEAAGAIAAEQRAVRANFIFLLGGEIQDEDVEAETSSEIAEGRFANKARQEIVAATVLMGRVERALTAVSTKEALPFARDAVRALQRAFGHSRYLLRALPARARIDPARRLSGDVAAAADWNRALAPAASDPQAEAARSALMDLIAVAQGLEDTAARADAAGRLSRLAERVLAMAGGAGDLQAAARDLLAARDALSADQAATARAALQRAAVPLVVLAQRGRVDGTAVSRDAARLAGAAALGRPPGGGGR